MCKERWLCTYKLLRMLHIIRKTIFIYFTSSLFSFSECASDERELRLLGGIGEIEKKWNFVKSALELRIHAGLAVNPSVRILYFKAMSYRLHAYCLDWHI
jgi:hypothetical protein